MSINMDSLPTAAPPRPAQKLRFADVAVTATAAEFAGIYRNKQQHAPDFPATLSRALAAGVEKVMLTGMSLADVPTNLALARSHPSQVALTIGVHPYHADLAAADPSYLAQLADSVRAALALRPTPLAAFGELGLDYERLGRAGRDAQLRAFGAQLELAVRERWDLPLFLHCRGACADFVAALRPWLDRLPRRGLVHSFVGTVAEMRELVALGLDVGVNGFSFRDRESLEMVAAIPLERLQIETDAPWGEIKATSEVVKRYCVNAPALPGSKKKDKWDVNFMVKERNESCAISTVAFVVAGLKGISVEEVAEAAWKNSVAMFRLDESA
ncbi:hypothetical protein SLS56_009008 [Neofusicoccum ribis]|uniref:Uncharacterized protein n=1 Tax=Neofusicoccum ribis TaxID=45134 RepID=A0ABR3SII4_9PEZI